jgi:hypothetical protein
MKLILAAVNNQKNAAVLNDQVKMFVKLKLTDKLINSLLTTVSEMDMITVRLVTVTNGNTLKLMLIHLMLFITNGTV